MYSDSKENKEEASIMSPPSPSKRIRIDKPATENKKVFKDLNLDALTHIFSYIDYKEYPQLFKISKRYERDTFQIWKRNAAGQYKNLVEKIEKGSKYTEKYTENIEDVDKLISFAFKLDLTKKTHKKELEQIIQTLKAFNIQYISLIINEETTDEYIKKLVEGSKVKIVCLNMKEEYKNEKSTDKYDRSIFKQSEDGNMHKVKENITWKTLALLSDSLIFLYIHRMILTGERVEKIRPFKHLGRLWIEDSFVDDTFFFKLGKLQTLSIEENSCGYKGDFRKLHYLRALSLASECVAVNFDAIQNLSLLEDLRLWPYDAAKFTSDSFIGLAQLIILGFLEYYQIEGVDAFLRHLPNLKMIVADPTEGPDSDYEEAFETMNYCLNVKNIACTTDCKTEDLFSVYLDSEKFS